jgi:hypothetical protein
MLIMFSCINIENDTENKYKEGKYVIMLIMFSCINIENDTSSSSHHFNLYVNLFKEE